MFLSNDKKVGIREFVTTAKDGELVTTAELSNEFTKLFFYYC